MMHVKEIIFGTQEYDKLVQVRENILRKPLNLKFSKEDLAKEINQHHFAYFQNNKIVGGLILVTSENGKIKMRQVCVAEKMQGNGIGKDLVLFAENWAKERGFKQIYCHARKNALNFYSQLDYKVEGDVFEEVGLKHFKLVKEL